MLTYASILEKPKYDERGFQLATGEIIEAACAALRHCAAIRSAAPAGRTCATCNAVLADGPQPLTTYEKQSSQADAKLADLIKEYARDLRRNSSGSDEYPWEFAKSIADYLEILISRASDEQDRSYAERADGASAFDPVLVAPAGADAVREALIPAGKQARFKKETNWFGVYDWHNDPENFEYRTVYALTAPSSVPGVEREAIARALYEIQPLDDRLDENGDPIPWDGLASFCKELHYQQAAAAALAQAGAKLADLIKEYARDLRRNSSGSDEYPWAFTKSIADYLEVLISRAAPAKPTQDRSYAERADGGDQLRSRTTV